MISGRDAVVYTGVSALGYARFRLARLSDCRGMLTYKHNSGSLVPYICVDDHPRGLPRWGLDLLGNALA
jgi:hypothetical protein